MLFRIATMSATPHPTIDNKDLMISVKSSSCMEKPATCAQPMHEMMQRCWNQDPLQRPTFTELGEQLEGIIRTDEKYAFHSLLTKIIFW